MLDSLQEIIADVLDERIVASEAGHCLRVEDLTSEDAALIAERLRQKGTPARAHVHVLAAAVSNTHEITTDRAVELRNRKMLPFLLFVPSGVGHTASSLDNSFDMVRAPALLEQAASVLEEHLTESGLGPELQVLRRLLGREVLAERWASYLAAVSEEPSRLRLGAELWQVGLVPDLGDASVVDRLRQNAEAVRLLSKPLKATATVDERLDQVGLRAGAVRDALTQFLEREAGPLAHPTIWARRLLEAGAPSFDRWPFAIAESGDLESFAIASFRKPDGTADRATKLESGPEGQLFCTVSSEKPGVLVVSWKTTPKQVDDVAHWRLQVVPPYDLRSADATPLHTSKVKGEKRKATLRIEAEPDDLATGSLFVVRIVPLDSTGDELLLADGTDSAQESDQFQVRLVEEPPLVNLRRTTTSSVALASLHASLDGLEDLTEDLPGYDSDAQTFSVRIGRRRLAQVALSNLLQNLERAALQGPFAFVGDGSGGEVLDAELIERVDQPLPATLAERRRRFFTALREHAPRDLVEVVDWTPELRQAAADYVGTYRRALESATDEGIRRALLLVDTLSVSAETACRRVSAVIVLAHHPLRLAWAAAYDNVLRGWAAEIVGDPANRTAVDRDLVRRVTPANLPLLVISATGLPHVYHEEIASASGLYLQLDEDEPEAAAEAIAAVLGIPRAATSNETAARLVAARVRAYRATHGASRAMRVLAFNPGAGDLVAQAIEPIMRTDDEEQVSETIPPRVEIVAYSDQQSYSDPLAKLRSLQESLEPVGGRSHLLPQLGLAVRGWARISSDTEVHHMAILQDVATGELDVSGAPPGNGRTSTFDDLLSPLVSVRETVDGRASWRTGPVRASRGKKQGSDVIEAHRAHQDALGALLGSPSAPSLRVTLQPRDLAVIRAAHDRSDWVITLDRRVGLDLYDDPLGAGLGADSYVLDYAPDFVDGIGDRVTVTTAHRAEVLRILSRAMHDLGLAAVEQSVGLALDRLNLVSGRLALRLIGDTSLAREAVSLAALMAHLGARGQLDGTIVVPVDAHPEIFGSSLSEGGSARRCDLLLVRPTSRTFKVECVEVKSRKEARLPVALADSIVDQLQNTKDALTSRFFALDPPRLDGDLQRARLVSLLHYYGERAASNGLILDERLGEIHKLIDRIEDSPERVEISLRGYVLSLEGRGGFPETHRGVPISVLTAEDVGQAGFSTIVEETERSYDGPNMALPPSSTRGTPSRVPTTPPVLSPGVEPVDAPPQEPGGLSSPGTPTHADADGASPAGSVPAGSHPNEPDEVAPPDPEVSRRSVVIDLGVEAQGTAVAWEVSTKGSPHAFIVGIPGQGKSVTTRHVIRGFARQGVPSLVFDFHGDMAADPPADATVVRAEEGLPFNPFELDDRSDRGARLAAWELAEIVAYVCDLGEIQRNHVYKAIEDLIASADDRALPSMRDLADAVEVIESAHRGRNARERLTPLTDFGLFAEGAVEDFDPRGGGNGVVVDVSRLGLETVQLAAGAFLLRKVYRDMFTWGQSREVRLAVVLDEAHRLAKDVTLPKLMKEGRKYGVAAIVASQGAADFHRDVLGNAGTKIIFRTNYPQSKAVAGYLRGRGDQDLSQQIEQLGVGQAYVSTPDHPKARLVYMSRDDVSIVDDASPRPGQADGPSTSA